jgi:hypothetical protein
VDTIEALSQIKEELAVGDWVLIKGRRGSIPHSIAYDAAQLIYDGEGELYPDTSGEVAEHRVIEITLLTT